jgi:hypothetical protein
MPLLGFLALLLALLLICSFFPGFFFVRRLRWTPLEKLCGSVGLSLVLLYLAAWAIYCFGPKNQRPAYWVVAAAVVLLGVPSWRDAVRIFQSFRIRQTLLAFTFLLASTFTMLLMIRVYSGAGWKADWFEHFQRSLFFLDRLAPTIKLFGNYTIPARPPMQNVLTAFFLGLTSDRFELFQAIFGFFGMLLFLPCVLLLPALGVNKRRRLIPLMALFAASPVVLENATYSWTKSLAAFYVILAICLYLAGWRKEEKTRTAAAFLALAAGMLVHYSAGPYLVFMGLHYLVRVFRSRQWRDLAVVVVPSVLVLATWFGWSMKTYGMKATVASNTTVTSSAPGASQNALKILHNISDTIVPVWMRTDAPKWDQPNALGKLRDQAFTFYQLNLIFAMGAIGGPLVLWLLYRWLIQGEARPERLFWRILIPFCIVVGIAVVGERDPLGVPHLTLLALEVAGITLLAAAFSKFGRTLRLVVVLGCCLDFSLGVLLQARVESMENTPGETTFPDLSFANGRFQTTGGTPDSLAEAPWLNWTLKHRGELYARWLQEAPRGNERNNRFRALWPQVSGILVDGLRDDRDNWGGWAARHGGNLGHLADWAGGLSGGGTEIATGTFVLLFAGCLVLLLRQALESAPRAKPAYVKHGSARRARR